MEIEEPAANKSDGCTCKGHHFTKKQIIIGVIVVVVLAAVGIGLTVGLSANSEGHGGADTTTIVTTQVTTSPTVPTATPTEPQVTTVNAVSQPRPTGFTGSKAVLNNLRLPTNVKPVQYRFALDIDVAGRRYSGSNIAEVQVLSATDILVIHMKSIKLTTAPLLSTDLQFSQLIALSEYDYYAKNEFLYMMVNTPLEPGTYYMRFEYQGNMSTDLFGLFANQYRHLNGDIR